MAVAPLGRVDRYELLEKIGQGSFGGVYRARHVHTDQVVALKLADVALDPDAAARILVEGRAAASLRHPNVVGIVDGGVSEKGEAFVVMELLEGMTLAELVSREAPLPPPRATALALQMIDGLIAAHGAGVIHRDIKPSNVFVSPGDVVKVIDFGISKVRREGARDAVLTMPGVAMGTPGYMAPEQLGDASSVDARADVYSVGATLYEMLAKRRPIEADGFEEWMHKLARESPAPLATVATEIPHALCDVVDRALARDRDARWPSMQAMRDALAAAPSPSKSARAPARPRKLPWLFAIAGVALALLAVAILITLAVRSTPSPPRVKSVKPPASSGRTPSRPRLIAP